MNGDVVLLTPHPAFVGNRVYDDINIMVAKESSVECSELVQAQWHSNGGDLGG